MMQVDDALGVAAGTRIDAHALLSFAPGETVQADEVAILGLCNVLLRCVAELGAKVDKVVGISDFG